MRLAAAHLAVLCAALAGCAATPIEPRTPFDAARCPPPPADESGDRVIARFYEAFAHHDFPGMACSYDPEIEFTDGIFGKLQGKRALAMWSMLVSQGKDLEVQYSRVRAEGAEGHAHWDAQYTFPFLAFSNKVENSIDATFEIRNGKILRHTDRFDVRRWMRMALWPFGSSVGEGTIRDAVRSRLDDYVAGHPEFQEPPRP